MTSISDKDFYHLTISINKALNPMEAPLKIKHARSVIITTHRTKESNSIWAVVARQPLMENRFTAWKFCHLLHKVLREGHESALKHSQTHKKMILEMGKLWGHLQDGVGNCIQAYSKLLVTKLEFHEKNMLFPGSLTIDFREVEKFAGDDINVYFQLCVEIFDYLDDIIDLQLRVFGSINTYRMSSMTPQGQCRLAPLITLIQDSNPLYDLCVRIMFNLHDVLPNDILAGHRDRFRELFSKIKYFYDNVRPLQYFADLIQVPNLPDAAPNFTSKVDFGSYIPPVVFVQPDPDPVAESLVDMTEKYTVLHSSVQQNHEIVMLEDTIQEKQYTINQMQWELSNTKSASEAMENNYKFEITQLQNQIRLLNNELTSSKNQYSKSETLNAELELKLESMAELPHKFTEEEEKIKASEDRFYKLKTMYTQMRDEHISLLRQHSEANKILNKEKSEISKQMLKFDHLQQHLELEIKLKESCFSEKNYLESKLKEMTIKCNTLQMAFDDMNRKYNELETLKCAEANKYEVEAADLALCRSKITNFETSLTETQSAHENETKKLLYIISTYETDLKTKISCLNDLKKVYEIDIGIKNDKIRELQENLSLTEKVKQGKEVENNRLVEENLLAEKKVLSLQHKNANLDVKLESAMAEIKSLISTKQESEVMHKSLTESLLRNILKTIRTISAEKFNEPNQTTIDKSICILEKLEELLNEVNTVYQKCNNASNKSVEIVQKSVLLGYNFVMLHEQCTYIYNTTSDIQKGQDILTEANTLCGLFLDLVDIFGTDDLTNMEQCVGDINSNIVSIRGLLNQLKKMLNFNMEIGDLIESELHEMDKTIEEATEKFAAMLSNARAKDDGIKLEVNEKILDGCTSLLACIKLLIKKSKILQEEIVSSGRGNKTIKEFYKRNSQWTEGLISASKSVAKAANLLVEAADKAVSSESNQHFEIIVAAQEIAACTAQLVIASKVKAPRDSQKLADLTMASRSVSQATGVVVATVKDSNSCLEQSQDIDVTKLTSSQAKTMEMEIHVKVLELEQALQTERIKLATFRRKNYQNNED